MFVCMVLMMIVATLAIGQAQDQSGKRIYDGNCERCHGPEGRGTTKGPTLVPFESTYERVLRQVRHPECDMPAFTESDLSDEQVAQIVTYLKSIK